MLLEKDSFGRVKEHMLDYQVIAMIVLLGWVVCIAIFILDYCVMYDMLYNFRPKMQFIQNLVQDNVKRIMTEQLQNPSAALSHQKSKADFFMTKPSLVASCSVFGPKVSYKLVSELLFLFLTYFVYYLELVVSVGLPCNDSEFAPFTLSIYER